MNKYEIENLVSIILYGDVHETPYNVLREFLQYSPQDSEYLDTEQNTRIAIAATLAQMFKNTEKCVFCGSADVVNTHEHWTFCKECTALYTNMILQKSNCEHITKDSPFVERPPWYKNHRDSIPYIKGDTENTRCSVCGANVESDGW